MSETSPVKGQPAQPPDVPARSEPAEPGEQADGQLAGARRQGNDWALYRRLLGYVKPYWLTFVIAVVGFQLGSGAEAYFAKLFGDLIDSWPATTVMVPVLMLGAAFVRGIGAIVGEILLNRVSFTVVHNIRTQLFEQLLYLPSQFFDSSSQGHLISRITYNVAQLRSTATDALQTIVQDGGKLIVFLSVMFYMSWKLTLIFVATAPVVALIVGWASRRFRRISRRIQTSMGDVTHVASEAVSGYRVVRIFGGERYEQQRFENASRYNTHQNLKMVATKVVSTQVIQIFVAMALAVLIVVLWQPGVGGDLSTGQIVTFLGLAGLMARPLRKLTEVNARLQRGLAAAEDVFAQIDQPRETDQGEHDPGRVAGRIEFRGVNFRYASGPGPVLKDVELTIQPGETVALVGRSGSGKSTLVSLIPRFYEPDSGEILLDGHALPEYSLSALRRQIALVTQQVTLFNDTLRGNIAYGALSDASEEDIWDAIVRAHADVFIRELPQGLDTVVGDDGVLLSGGQRQRVAIARALLKDAPILILDEATSALDSTSERHIQAALEEVMRGRTTVVIAHRLSTIENADRILVMDGGRIIESGTHDELLEAQGAYAELHAAQFDEEGSEGRHVRQAGGLDEHRAAGSAARRKSSVLTVIEKPAVPLEKAWYGQSAWLSLLSPLSAVYGRVAHNRRMSYRTGKRQSWRADVPVLVVGNITAGGTGKTPLVRWLVRQLSELGFQPGIVSRGYGGRNNRAPLSVVPDSDPDACGDEAPILAAGTGVPVVVCRDRVRAVQHLLNNHAVDVVVADDGLQHYALARDLEIAVLDAQRGLGNGRLLPAGPLREPPERLAEVDWVISNGGSTGLVPEEWIMTLEPRRFVGLGSDEGVELDPGRFAELHRQVNAVAGIGNPERFARTLGELGITCHLVALPDHHRYRGPELEFDNDWPVVITEKDAVKVSRLAGLPERLFYLEVAAEVRGPDGTPGRQRLLELLAAHGLGTP